MHLFYCSFYWSMIYCLASTVRPVLGSVFITLNKLRYTRGTRLRGILGREWIRGNFFSCSMLGHQSCRFHSSILCIKSNILICPISFFLIILAFLSFRMEPFKSTSVKYIVLFGHLVKFFRLNFWYFNSEESNLASDYLLNIAERIIGITEYFWK